MKKSLNKNIMNHPLFLLIFLLFITGIFSSCTTFNTTSGSFSGRDFKFTEKDMFLLYPVRVTSYGFLEEEEAKYIFNEKLFYELNRDKRFRVSWYRKHESPGDEHIAEYKIIPELIIKPYTNSYLDKNLYILRVLILRKDRQICYFRSEYNGSNSIFERKVLNSLVGGFVKNFNKFFK